jgi:protein phosphatase
MDLAKGTRLIAVSDLHGHVSLLRRMLEKLAFSKEDVLVVVGDILERGPNGLETLREIMALCETHRVYPLMGNVDLWVLEHCFAAPEKREGGPSIWRRCRFFAELCAEQCLRPQTEEEYEAARQALCRAYAKELDWL